MKAQLKKELIEAWNYNVSKKFADGSPSHWIVGFITEFFSSLPVDDHDHASNKAENWDADIRRDEMERCARICEEMIEKGWVHVSPTLTLREAAAKIRGEKDNEDLNRKLKLLQEVAKEADEWVTSACKEISEYVTSTLAEALKAARDGGAMEE